MEMFWNPFDFFIEWNFLATCYEICLESLRQNMANMTTLMTGLMVCKCHQIYCIYINLIQPFGW
jgi:hypothetical protein